VGLVNQMADGFYTSPEFGSNGWEVLSMCEAVLGRLPNFADWLTLVSPLRPGTTPVALTNALFNQMTASTEYQNDVGGPVNNTNFVQQTILKGWGRPAPPAEVTQYVNQLNASTSPTPRLDFLNQTIFTNPPFRQGTNPLWVSMLYYTILVRDPDQAGFNFWAQSSTNPAGPDGNLLRDARSESERVRDQVGDHRAGRAAESEPAGIPGSPEFQGLIQ